MFNSVLKKEDAEESFEEIVDFYYKNKDTLKEPLNLNRPNNQQ